MVPLLAGAGVVFCTFVLAWRVTGRHRSGVIAATTQGEVRARWAFDGRPASPSPKRHGEVDWVQHFVGLEVETERPVFDPSVATLMDFRVMDGDDIRFMYVLPLDERRALVEDTFFGGAPRPESEYVDAIAEYLDERLDAGPWRETHRERGAIPMRTVRPQAPDAPRVALIGVRAGMARPSTGYARPIHGIPRPNRQA